MTREHELKFRIRDKEAIVLDLKHLGLELTPPVRQIDQAYAPGDWTEGANRIGIAFARLRTTGTRHTFTIKQPVTGVLDCIEHETEVTDRDAMHHALLAMGYRPTVMIDKTRQTAQHGSLTVCLDTVSGLGDFLEIEYLAHPDTPTATIRSHMTAAIPPSIRPEDRINIGYDSLITASDDDAGTAPESTH